MEEHQCLIATLNSKFSRQVLKCWVIFAYVIRHSFAHVRAILIELCVLRKYVDKIQFCDSFLTVRVYFVPYGFTKQPVFTNLIIQKSGIIRRPETETSRKSSSSKIFPFQDRSRITFLASCSVTNKENSKENIAL